MTTKIFLNAAGFLRILQTTDHIKTSKSRHNEDTDTSDPLDNTRIHPEDYELARKIATDAFELDEDVHDEHPSHVVSLIMSDSEIDKMLDELESTWTTSLSLCARLTMTRSDTRRTSSVPSCSNLSERTVKDSWSLQPGKSSTC